MRSRAVRLAILLTLGLSGALPAAAAAAPVSGPHQVVDNRFTTTKPNAATGFSYDGRYHAANDPEGDPPFMQRMVSYMPRGLRFDTGVPDRCTASDLELALRGAEACPPGSRLGGGTTTVKFMGQFPDTVNVDMFNNTNEQIIVARSPLLATVARGRIRRNDRRKYRVEFASPTCFPSPPGAECPADNVLQVASSIVVPRYTRRSSSGRRRSYMRTPRTCPVSRHWRTPIRFWWEDGSVDTVVTRQRCRPPA